MCDDVLNSAANTWNRFFCTATPTQATHAHMHLDCGSIPANLLDYSACIQKQSENLLLELSSSIFSLLTLSALLFIGEGLFCYTLVTPLDVAVCLKSLLFENLSIWFLCPEMFHAVVDLDTLQKVGQGEEESSLVLRFGWRLYQRTLAFSHTLTVLVTLSTLIFSLLCGSIQHRLSFNLNLSHHCLCAEDKKKEKKKFAKCKWQDDSLLSVWK